MSKKMVLNAIKAHNSEKQAYDSQYRTPDNPTGRVEPGSIMPAVNIPSWYKENPSSRAEGNTSPRSGILGNVGGTFLDYYNNLVDSAVGGGQAVGGAALSGLGYAASPLEDLTDWASPVTGWGTPGHNSLRDFAGHEWDAAGAGLHDAGSFFRPKNWRALNRRHTPDVTGYEKDRKEFSNWIDETTPPNQPGVSGMAHVADATSREALKQWLLLRTGSGIPGVRRVANWWGNLGPKTMAALAAYEGYNVYKGREAGFEQAEAYDQMRNKAYRDSSDIIAKNLYGNLSEDQFDTLGKDQQIAMLRQRRQDLMEKQVSPDPNLIGVDASKLPPDYPGSTMRDVAEPPAEDYDKYLHAYNVLLGQRGPESLEQIKVMNPEDQRFWLGLSDPTASPEQIAQFQQYGFNPEPKNLSELTSRSKGEIRYLLQKDQSWYKPPSDPTTGEEVEWRPPTDAEIDAQVEIVKDLWTPPLPEPFGDGQDNPDVDLLPEEELLPPVDRQPTTDIDIPGSEVAVTDPGAEPEYEAGAQLPVTGDVLGNLQRAIANQAGPSTQQQQEAPWYQGIADWWGTLSNEEKFTVGGSLLALLGGPILGSQGHGTLGGAAALGGLGGLGYVASQNPMNFARRSYPLEQPHAGAIVRSR